MKRFLVTAAAVWAATLAASLSAGNAASLGGAQISGALSVDYSRDRSEGEGAHSFGATGSVLASFGNPGLNVQLDVGGDRLRIEGENSDGWSGALDGFWRDSKGSIGFTAAHGVPEWADGMHSQSYGLFGEWYFWPELTLRAKGGWTAINESAGKHTGGFAGVAAEYYFIPDLGLSLGGDYTSVEGLNMRQSHVAAEYLFFRDFPLSLRASYDYQKFGQTNVSAYMFRLKYRFGATGALVTLDRSGPTAWTGASPLFMH